MKLKYLTYILVSVICLSVLLASCGSTLEAVSQGSGLQSTSVTSTTNHENEASNVPEDSTNSTTMPLNNTTGTKVQMLYFHAPIRCVTCLYFEEHIRHTMNTYFLKEVNDGTLTLSLIDIGDEANYPLVEKYKTVGTQLFINTTVDGVENIRNVWEIYSWGTGNDEAFEEGLRQIICGELGR